MNQTRNALIVPVEVFGFAVNRQDEIDATARFSGANAVFTDQTGKRDAVIGANIVRDLTASPAQPLEAGIHVHWRLPSLFGRADSSSGTLAFPPVPNRWLVSRFVLKGRTASRTSWVVLSDRLNDAEPDGQTAVSLPTLQTETGQDYQFVGEHQPFDAQWTDPEAPDTRRFQKMAGMTLTAVANGYPTFATYYPNCRSVFGFADHLADVKVPSGQSVRIAYTVIGWFADPSQDPLDGGLTLAQIEQKLGWTFKEEPNATPDQSLFYGQVQGIDWHPSSRYLPNYKGGPPPTKLDVSIANTPPEALARYLAEIVPLRSGDPELFEIMLNAYLEGFLASAASPRPDQIAALRDRLHENRFRAENAGSIYALFKTTDPARKKDGSSRPGTKLAELPLPLGNALNVLNTRLMELQRLEDAYRTYASQLYFDWYRIFMVSGEKKADCANIASNKYFKLRDLIEGIKAARVQRERQLDIVEALVPAGYELREVPAPRYWRPNDPVFILGGDNPFTPRRGVPPGEHVPCRLQGQTVTKAKAHGTTVTTSTVQASGLPPGSALPNAKVFESLTLEVLLLNADLLTAHFGKPVKTADIDAALAGKPTCLTLTGLPPAPAAVTCWKDNPWIPQYVRWCIMFEPIVSTVDRPRNGISDYREDYFTSRFRIDQDQGGAITCNPTAAPTAGDFSQRFTGTTILAPGSLDPLVSLLDKDAEPILKECFDALQDKFLSVQPFGGLSEGFLMQDLAMQVKMRVPEGSLYEDITGMIGDILNSFGKKEPNFRSFYNPIRGGYFRAEFLLVDAFGQQLAVEAQTTTISRSLTAFHKNTPVPGLAFLNPCLAQAARLNFRFLSADTADLEEMNEHPATSPVCGWILPNRLSESLFLYDADGAILGYLQLKNDGSAVLWQAAPGNDATIGDDLAKVMRDQQPQLRDLALYLQSAPGDFRDFLRAVDNVNGLIEPSEITNNNDLAVLIGRPLALVKTMLSLQLQGMPEVNQSWAVLDLDENKYPFFETDCNFTSVKFPVILGNLNRLNDGLIGYFKATPTGFDMANFYTEGTANTSPTGVQAPRQDTVTLTAFPPLGKVLAPGAKQKLLMIIDPRAAVHATTGILPTKSIRIPPDLFADAVRALEMTFLTAPVLSGPSLSLPLPEEAGYTWSWVQEKPIGNAHGWETRSDLLSAETDGLSAYTPQNALEGWLRLNPDLLQFELRQADGAALIRPDVENGMTLRLTNRQNREITFHAGRPVEEGKPPAGSVFYIHFDAAFPTASLLDLKLSAPGWAFQYYESSQRMGYWAASPTVDTSLNSLDQLSIRVERLVVNTKKQQVSLTFHYEAVKNLNDGVYREMLLVSQSR